jgi:hypothetical protein
LGRDIDLSDNKAKRFGTMLMVAFGQSKMTARPIPFIMHFFIYAAFLITQIELIEIVIDGSTGQHRYIWHLTEGGVIGSLYTFTINFIEILSVLAFEKYHSPGTFPKTRNERLAIQRCQYHSVW